VRLPEPILSRLSGGAIHYTGTNACSDATANATANATTNAEANAEANACSDATAKATANATANAEANAEANPRSEPPGQEEMLRREAQRICARAQQLVRAESPELPDVPSEMAGVPS